MATCPQIITENKLQMYNEVEQSKIQNSRTTCSYHKIHLYDINHLFKMKLGYWKTESLLYQYG